MSTQDNDTDFANFSKQLNTSFNLIFWPIFANIGILLNIISIIILNRKVLRNTTMGFYNIVLAGINGLLMIVLFWFSFPTLYFKASLLWNMIYCKLINFLSRLLADLSSWVNVLFCFDRMICMNFNFYLNMISYLIISNLGITFPRRFKFIKNKIFLFGVLFLMVVIISAVNFQSFEYSVEISYSNSTKRLNDSSSNSTEIYTCTAELTTVLSLTLIDAIFRVTLPFLFSIVLDTILIYNLTSVKRERWLKRDEKFARSVS